jgi:hypothetical protein
MTGGTIADVLGCAHLVCCSTWVCPIGLLFQDPALLAVITRSDRESFNFCKVDLCQELWLLFDLR